jgi:transcriptional regulator with GAF, ATPase, and Fis domain
METPLHANIFQEVTNRICGNLDVSQALYETFCYLKNKLPLAMIFFSRYEIGQTKKSARLIAFANDDGGFFLDEPIAIKKKDWVYIDRWLKESIKKTVPWIKDHTHPMNINIRGRLFKRFSSRYQAMIQAPYCTITCALKIKDQVIGNLIMVKEGCDHYNQTHVQIIHAINQPFAIALSNALRYRELEQHHKALQKETTHIHENQMIGSDSGLQEVKHMIEDVAPTDSPVVLLGNTGTGKEVAALEIHKLSARCTGPMISLNCGAVPETLIDSELFGHEKGSFTGAVESRPGKFERAHKGTLFLDEVGELPVPAQAKLLRVLQTGEFERVGGSQNLKCDVRIIAATNRNIPERIQKKKFRSDLWYRLNVFPISIPDLKYHKQDIPAMLDYFITKKCREMNIPIKPGLSPGAMDRLLEYDWPGNVRELQNLVERALILSKGSPLSFSELKLEGDFSSGFKSREFRESDWPVKKSSFDTLNQAMANHIKGVLTHTWGKISGPGGAAEILDIHPNTLRNRMIKLGIRN